MIGVSLFAMAPSAGGAVVVFWAAMIYALRVREGSGPLSWERMLRVGILLVVFLGVTLPATVGLIGAANTLLSAASDPQDPAGWLVPAVVGLLLWASLRLALQWPERLGQRTFVVIALTAAVSLRLAYVLMVESQPVSDFGGMWRLCWQAATEGLVATRAALPATYTAWVHFERVLPYLLPLRALFGPEPSSYSVANVALGAASSLLACSLARAWFGDVAARVALVLSLLAVEPLLAAAIPTHDIPGAFLLLAALALGSAAWRFRAAGSSSAATLAAVGLGFTVLVLDLQRSLGGLLLASHTLAAPLLARETPPAAPVARSERTLLPVLLVVAPLFIFATGDSSLRAGGWRVPSRLNALPLGVAAATDSWGDASYQHALDNYRLPYQAVELNWTRLGIVKLATGLRLDPAAQVGSYLRKARGLFDLGAQTYFYLHDVRWRDGAPFGWVRRAEIAARAFSVPFLVLLILASVWPWTHPRLPLLALFPLVFMALLSLALLAVGEIQSRYLYPLWYIGAVYVGGWLASRRRDDGGGSYAAGSGGDPQLAETTPSPAVARTSPAGTR